MTKQTFVIIGASLAGAKAAIELREQGYDGEVLLVGSEAELPYERPPLSKDLLQGKAKPEDSSLEDEAFYEDHRITVITDTTAERIDPGERKVHLDNGSRPHYDALLLATGSAPRHLEIPGAELENVIALRTLPQAEKLARLFERGGRLVVIGGGWIGSEVAASGRTQGMEVAIVDPAAAPNARIFGPEIGAFYAGVHERHGVDLHYGDSAVELVGKHGHVTGVRLASGTELAADVVVVGIGAEPRVALAAEAGLNVDDGILCDSALRTSAAGVFAAGDVARAMHPFYGERIRVEHWANALNQGPAAARSMLGQRVDYDRIPYFFSDQYDVGMEYTGYAPSWDEVVFRGSREGDGEFIAFWLSQGRVLAGMNVNVWDVTDPIQALIRSRAKVDVADLENADLSLAELAESVGS